MLYLLLGLLIIPLGVWGVSQEVNRFLQEVPSQELLEIKTLFQVLFRDNEFGFSLFGDKPISFCFLPLSSRAAIPLTQIRRYFEEPDLPLWRGIEAWNNHSNKLSMKKYRLLFPSTHGAVIINLPAFLEIFRKNKRLFRRIYGGNVTTDLLLRKWSLDFEYFRPTRQHVLLGMILSYGKHNAQLFQKYHGLHLMRCTTPLFPETERETQKCELGFFQDFPPFLLQFDFVNFAADRTHPETRSLIQKYSQVGQKLSRLYKRDNWFDRILEQLNSS
jgi:hypothetical protein